MVLFIQDTTLNLRGYAYFLEQYTMNHGYYPDRIDMTEDCFERYVSLLPCFDGIEDAKNRIVTFNGIPVKWCKIDNLKGVQL
jgi:hypothetical protein